MAGRKDQFSQIVDPDIIRVIDCIFEIQGMLHVVIEDMERAIDRKYEWNTYEIEKWVKELKRIQEKL